MILDRAIEMGLAGIEPASSGLQPDAKPTQLQSQAERVGVEPTEA